MSRSRLNAQQMLLMAHSWLKEDTVKSAHTNLKGIVSRCVIVDFFAYFRQLVVEDLKEVDEVIGGPGIEVEIDESSLLGEKYNRGHRVGDKSWVFGGIEKMGNIKSGLQKLC